MSIDLTPDLEARLVTAAARHGQSVPDYLRSELDRLLPPAPAQESAEERQARVDAIAGKYAYTGITLADYSEEKRGRTRH